MKYTLLVFRILLGLVFLVMVFLVAKGTGKKELDLVDPYGQGVAVVVWDEEALDQAYWNKVDSLANLSRENGKSFYLLTDKHLSEIMPSNGGVVIFSDGIIVDKFPPKKIMSKRMKDTIASDTDFTTAEYSARDGIAITTLFVSLLLFCMIIKHIIKRRKLSE